MRGDVNHCCCVCGWERVPVWVCVGGRLRVLVQERGWRSEGAWKGGAGLEFVTRLNYLGLTCISE